MEIDSHRSICVSRQVARALCTPGRLVSAHHVAACRTEGLIQVIRIPLLPRSLMSIFPVYLKALL